MTNPREPIPKNHSELGPQIATFILADELMEVLALQSPVASNELFSVSDPRTLQQIEVPVEISTENLATIVFNFSTRTDTETLEVHREASIMLEFESSTAYISYGSGGPRTSLDLDVVDHSKQDGIRSGTIPVQQISDMVSRALRPYSDPIFSDHSDLSSTEQMDDARMTLSQNEFVSKSSITHHVHGYHHIDISVENGKLRELSIEQPFDLDGSEGLVLRVTQATAEYSLQLFHREHDGSREIPASEEEIEAFRDILIDVAESLRNKVSAPTTIIDVDDVNEGLL